MVQTNKTFYASLEKLEQLGLMTDGIVDVWARTNNRGLLSFAVVVLLGLIAAPVLAVEPVFLNQGVINGSATLGTTSRSGYWSPASGSRYEDLAQVNSSGLSLASSVASLRFSGSPGQSTKTIEYATFANPSSAFGSAQATLGTSTVRGGGPTYIPVTIRGSLYGEKTGAPVTVTIKARAVSTKSSNDTNLGYNYFYVYVNGGQVLQKVEYSGGTKSYSNSYSFRSTIGSSFNIAMYGSSYGLRKSSSTYSSSSLQFIVDIQVK